MIIITMFKRVYLKFSHIYLKHIFALFKQLYSLKHFLVQQTFTNNEKGIGISVYFIGIYIKYWNIYKIIYKMYMLYI